MMIGPLLTATCNFHEGSSDVMLTIDFNVKVHDIFSEMISLKSVTVFRRAVAPILGGCVVFSVVPAALATTNGGSCHVLCHLGTCIKGCVSTDSSFTAQCDKCKCTFGWKGELCADLAPIHFIGIFCGIFALILLCILGCNIYRRLYVSDSAAPGANPWLTLPGTRREPPPRDPFVPIDVDTPMLCHTQKKKNKSLKKTDNSNDDDEVSDTPSIYGYLDQDYMCAGSDDDGTYTPPWLYTPSMSRRYAHLEDQESYLSYERSSSDEDDFTPPATPVTVGTPVTMRTPARSPAGTPSKKPAARVPSIVVSHAS